MTHNKNHPTYHSKVSQLILIIISLYIYILTSAPTIGVGGIFFDNQFGSFDDMLEFQRRCAHAFIPAYLPLVTKHMGKPFNERQSYWQSLRSVIRVI